MDSEEYSTELLTILWDKNPRRAFLTLADLFVSTNQSPLESLSSVLLTLHVMTSRNKDRSSIWQVK